MQRLRFVAMISRPMPQRLSSETCPAKIQDRKVTQTCAYRPRLRGGCLKPETVSNFSNFCMRLLQSTTPHLQRTPLCNVVQHIYILYIYIYYIYIIYIIYIYYICTRQYEPPLPKDIPPSHIKPSAKSAPANLPNLCCRSFHHGAQGVHRVFQLRSLAPATDQRLPHCLQRLQRLRRHQFMIIN
jgi:hypothetical protein